MATFKKAKQSDSPESRKVDLHSCKSSNLPEDFRISITSLGSTYVIKTMQTLPIQREKAFAFFENPQNLFDITPDWLDFRMDAYQQGEKVFEGAEYDYHILWSGLRFKWKSKIQDYNPPCGFTDIQIAGPYSKWEHTHIFEEQGDKTLMLDSVVYRLPFSYLGRLVHDVIVKNQLRDIFCYRALKVRDWATGERNARSIPDQGDNNDENYGI